eukprot:scaffold63623_cov42-Phaeocystis_antarctica.AAC.1
MALWPRQAARMAVQLLQAMTRQAQRRRRRWPAARAAGAAAISLRSSRSKFLSGRAAAAILIE